MRSRSRNSVPFSLFAFQDIITSVTGIMILMTMMLALEMIQKKESSPELITPAIANKLATAIADNDREIAKCQQTIATGSAAIRVDSDILRKRLDEIRAAREELERQNAALTADLKTAESRQAGIEREAQQVSPERSKELQIEVAAMREQLQKLKATNRVIFNRTQGEPKTPWLLEVDRGGIVAAETGKNMRPLKFPSADELFAWAKTQNAGSVYFVLLLKPDGADQFGPLREKLQGNGFEIGYDLLAADQQAIDRESGAGMGEP